MKICITKVVSLVLLSVNTNLFSAAVQLNNQLQFEQQQKKDFDAVIAASIASENAAQEKREAEAKQLVDALKASEIAKERELREKLKKEEQIFGSLRTELRTLKKIIQNKEEHSNIGNQISKIAALCNNLLKSNHTINQKDSITAILLDQISAQIMLPKNQINVPEERLWNQLFKNIDNKDFFTEPEFSFDSTKSQFEIGDSGSACGAMTLVAIEELKKFHGNLVGLSKKNGASSDIILGLGASAYGDIIKALHKKTGDYLNIDEIQKSNIFKTYHLSKIGENHVAINKEDISITIKSMLQKIKTASSGSGHGAAAAAGNQDNHENVYGTVTFSGTTIMIAYIAATEKWILFDSHRRDKYEAEGSGYHQFATQDALAGYLIGYPGLVYDDNKKDYQNIVETNLFS